MHYLLLVCKFNDRKWNCCLYLRGCVRHLKLCILLLSKCVYLLLSRLVHYIYHRKAMLHKLSSIGSFGGVSWKPELYKYLSRLNLLAEQLGEPVQHNVSDAFWNIVWFFGDFWGCPMLRVYCSKLHSKIELSVHHILPVCKLYVR